MSPRYILSDEMKKEIEANAESLAKAAMFSAINYCIDSVPGSIGRSEHYWGTNERDMEDMVTILYHFIVFRLENLMVERLEHEIGITCKEATGGDSQGVLSGISEFICGAEGAN